MATPPTPPCSPPSALSLVCLLTLWLVPWMQRAVAVLPVPGTAWWAAARTAALESGRSSTTVLPFFSSWRSGWSPFSSTPRRRA